MAQIFRAIRPLSVFAIILTQILSVYFLGFKNSLETVFDLIHLKIYLLTFLCSVFGYLVNNYMDAFSDRDNQLFKPGASISNSKIFFISLCTFLLAIIISFITSTELGIKVLIVLFSLVSYNTLLQRLPIIGNILLAFLFSYSILVLLSFDSNLKTLLIIVFSIFIFGLTLIRSIIKNLVNIEGDTNAGFKTFPVIAGIKSTRILLIFILFMFILLLTTCIRLITINYFSPPLSYLFLAYNIICIGLPLFHLLSKLQFAFEKEDFIYLMKVTNYTLITGILSMLFF